MAIQGRSSGRSQDIAFGNVAASLRDATFQLGAMAGAAQQLYSTLNVFRELEKQLTLTNAIAGGNAETFKQMEKAVRDFSLGVTYSAAESANALLQLTQAGFSVQQSIEAMSGVLTLSAATLEDVNETADLVASTLTSFSLQAGDASRVGNLFAASMNQSQASLPKLSFAMRQVGPVAAAMGVSLEQTTGALSALFNVGLRGEQAGTALRNVMVNLVSPAGEAAKVIKTLGLNVYNADGQMRDFFEILDDLSKFNLSNADLAALFGREALAGGTALLRSAASGQLREMTDAMTGTQESVRVALEQMQSFDAQLKLARNSIDEMRTALGEDLAQKIIPILGYITDMGIAFRELDKPTRDYMLTFATFTAGAAVGIPLLAKLGGGVVSLAGSFVELGSRAVTGASDAIGAMRMIGGAQGGASRTQNAIAGLTLAASSAAPAIGLAAAAIAGAGGLIYAFKQARDAYDQARFDEMFGEFEGFAQGLSRGFSNFRQINAANQGTPDFIQGMVQQITTAREIVKSKEKDVAYLQEQAKEFGSIRIDLSNAFLGGGVGGPKVNSRPYDKLIQQQFGIDDNSTAETVSAAVKKAAADQTSKIAAILAKARELAYPKANLEAAIAKVRGSADLNYSITTLNRYLRRL